MRRLPSSRSTHGVRAHALEVRCRTACRSRSTRSLAGCARSQVEWEGHEKVASVQKKSWMHRTMSKLLPAQVMWGWVTSQKSRPRLVEQIVTPGMRNERARRLFRTLSRSVRGDEFLLLFNVLDKVCGRCAWGWGGRVELGAMPASRP